MKRVVVSLTVIFLILVCAFLFAPRAIDRAINRVLPRTAPRISKRAADLYERLRVVDLHADPTLWQRDLTVRAAHGHVDVPRLIEGNVALQAFTVATKIPFSVNIDRNSGGSDMMTALVISSRWPMRSWFDLTERALHQARQVRDAAAALGERFVIIESVADLDRYLETRDRDTARTAGFIGLEGAHALEGDLSTIDVLFDAGFRMMAPTHFFDNDLSGSAHGVRRGGLTDKGREMIRRMEAKHILLDLAHASAEAMDDAFGMVTRPVVVSHTGVKGTCDNNRNLSDDQIRGISATGGVIGIGYWDVATCGDDGRAVAKAIRYVADLVGTEHVGLGSDFDGATTTPFDTTGLVEIVDALMAEKFDEQQIALIMGDNTLRVLRETLP